MAIGIVAFVLVALLGLMSVGVKADRESRVDTVVAGLATSVLGELTGADYAGIQNTNRLFDYDGLAAGSTNGFFRCEVLVQEPAIDRPEMAISKSVNLKFSWPCRTTTDEGLEHRVFSTAVVPND